MNFRSLGVVGAICMSLLASPSFAQQSIPEAGSSATTAPSTVAPAAAAPQPGGGKAPETRTQQFEDWAYRCTDMKVSEKFVSQCELLQVQQVKQGEQVANVLVLAIAQIAAEKAGEKPGIMLTGVVPYNIFLPEGLQLAINGKPLVRLPFRNCDQQGCWTQAILDDKVLATLKSGKEGVARFIVMNGKGVDVKFSLKGFTAGLTALENGADKNKAGAKK